MAVLPRRPSHTLIVAMHRTPIPPGITREDVIRAIADLKAGTVTHEFHESERYDLVYEGERYAPKAVLGVAARRVAGRLLTPADFSGGEGSTCFRIRRELGFTVERKPGVGTPVSPASAAGASEDWSEAELDAAVAAYLEMLAQEQSGQPYNKAATNRDLREGVLSGRSRGSVEFRMANISAVLRDQGRQWIKGYQPRANVGSAVAERILASLRRNGAPTVTDLEPEDDEGRLGEKVRKIRKVGTSQRPAGQLTPEKNYRSQSGYKRDPQVKAWTLEKAKGICELCDGPAPFLDMDGFPFLEVHHVKHLARGGSDTPTNAVALCPNCHRRCHDSKDREEMADSLLAKIGRLIRE